jgi:hypothetical protein
MGRHRLARPDGANFRSGIVANREHEIEFRRAGNGEFIPVLGAEALGGMVELLQQVEGVGMNLALWLASRAVGFEFSQAFALQDCFGENGTGGIAGAEKKKVSRCNKASMLLYLALLLKRKPSGAICGLLVPMR